MATGRFHPQSLAGSFRRTHAQRSRVAQCVSPSCDTRVVRQITRGRVIRCKSCRLRQYRRVVLVHASPQQGRGVRCDCGRSIFLPAPSSVRIFLTESLLRGTLFQNPCVASSFDLHLVMSSLFLFDHTPLGQQRITEASHGCSCSPALPQQSPPLHSQQLQFTAWRQLESANVSRRRSPRPERWDGLGGNGARAGENDVVLSEASASTTHTGSGPGTPEPRAATVSRSL